MHQHHKGVRLYHTGTDHRRQADPVQDILSLSDTDVSIPYEAIIRRYLTLNPKMLASRELKDLTARLHRIDKADFKKDYQARREKWKDTINHKSLHKDGKMHYTHRRLRSCHEQP